MEWEVEVNANFEDGYVRVVFAVFHIQIISVLTFAVSSHIFPLLMTFLHFSHKKGKNMPFLQKWRDTLLFMKSHIVIIATDFHQTYVILCLRDMRAATENVRSS